MFKKHEFLYGPDLQKRILQVFGEAEREIIIISPYIKLFDKIKDSLRIPPKYSKIRIKILFGKNFIWAKDDMKFIKQFPNVIVKHKENLHAKFYANERLAISTSMNLLESSFKNNYETGVLIEYDSELASFMKGYIITAILYYVITVPFWIINAFIMPLVTLNLKWFEKDKLTYESKEYVKNLFEESDDIVFEKKTIYPNFFLKFKKQESESKISIDRFDEFSQIMGYCIRSGDPIDYNPNQPYSKESYRDWIKEGSNRNQQENFCHRTGKPSNGKTSINNPVLYSS